ncbi:MAG: DUF4149 domain-containing protein [Thiohalomonadales bacterium]
MYQTGERILLTVWIGGMWAIGYIVVPTLFSLLDDRILAGTIAGRLFSIMSFIGIFSSVVLLAGLLMQYGKNCFSKAYWQSWILLVMLIIILIGQFILQPIMSDMREAGLVGEVATNFGRLHGVSSVLFLINSLGGLVLIVFGLNRNPGLK